MVFNYRFLDYVWHLVKNFAASPAVKMLIFAEFSYLNLNYNFEYACKPFTIFFT